MKLDSTNSLSAANEAKCLLTLLDVCIASGGGKSFSEPDKCSGPEVMFCLNVKSTSFAHSEICISEHGTELSHWRNDFMHRSKVESCKNQLLNYHHNPVIHTSV